MLVFPITPLFIYHFAACYNEYLNNAFVLLPLLSIIIINIIIMSPEIRTCFYNIETK